MSHSPSSFARAQQIADAVLLEGYVLYPYRASSAKNRWRFPFGVLAPRAWSEAGGCEPWWSEAQLLVEAPDAPAVRGRLRFLRARRRTSPSGAEAPWDEGVPSAVDFEVGPGRATTLLELPGGTESDTEEARDAAAPVRRVLAPLIGRVETRLEPVRAPRPVWRLTVRASNETPFTDLRAPREAALPAALLATHLVLEATAGAFLSVQDPPAWAREAADACRSTGLFPVLAGEEGARDLVLAAPIILYDHPRLAPESAVDFFDGTEIDELLALRTATLTAEEKAEARATDPRAAALVDRVEALSPESLVRLHGTFRDRAAGEMVPQGGPGDGVRPGDQVRLRPGLRRTDAQDLLYAGLVATVRAVRRDVEGRAWLAVTVDDDPAAELHHAYGRHHWFAADEVEPLGAPEGRAP